MRIIDKEHLKIKLKNCEKQNAKLRRLLNEAFWKIPEYADGCNDSLLDRIAEAIDEKTF